MTRPEPTAPARRDRAASTSQLELDERVAARFPLMAEYLAGVPDGLGAYPQCESRSSLYLHLLESDALAPDLAFLPARMRELVTRGSGSPPWIPSVTYNALFIAAVERRFRDERAAGRWNFESRARMFRAPLYRVLMAVVSPRMILAGAQRRWERFHRGLEFELDYGDNWAHFGLHYPPRLHNRISAQMIISGVCAALDAAGATRLRWTVDRVDETFGSASARWR